MQITLSSISIHVVLLHSVPPSYNLVHSYYLNVPNSIFYSNGESHLLELN